jgi:ribosomal protein L32
MKNDLVHQCQHHDCRRVKQVDGTWKPDLERLANAPRDPKYGIPMISHGICPKCAIEKLDMCPLCGELLCGHRDYCRVCGAYLEEFLK